MEMGVPEVNDRSLDIILEGAVSPVLVGFFSSIEPDTVALWNVLLSFVDEFESKIIFAWIDVEENPVYTRSWCGHTDHPAGPPFVMMFKRGRVVAWTYARNQKLVKYVKEMIQDSLTEKSA